LPKRERTREKRENLPIARLQTGAGDVAGVCPPPQLAGENRLATPVGCANDKAYEANYVRGGRDGEVGERGGGRRGRENREEEGDGRTRKYTHLDSREFAVSDAAENMFCACRSWPMTHLRRVFASPLCVYSLIHSFIHAYMNRE
jgi:hypothetical protein